MLSILGREKTAWKSRKEKIPGFHMRKEIPTFLKSLKNLITPRTAPILGNDLLLHSPRSDIHFYNQDRDIHGGHFLLRIQENKN